MDHQPPHFHAEYAEFSAQILIKELSILEGYLPSKALALIVEWANIHQEDLMKHWKSLSEEEMGLFKKIEPLE